MAQPFKQTHNHPLNREIIAKYLELRDPGHEEEYVHILCVPDVNKIDTNKVQHLPQVIIAPRRVEGTEWRRIERLNKQGCAVFIAFNIRSHERSIERSTDHMRTALGLVIDIDDEANVPKELPITPTFTVRSSANRLHAYFMFTAPMRHNKFKLGNWTKMMKGLAEDYGGDPKICIETVLIRVPGTYNCKIKPGKDQPTLVELVENKQTPRYAINKLSKLFRQKPKPEIDYDFSAGGFAGIEGDVDKIKSALDWLNRDEMPNTDLNFSWAVGMHRDTDDREPWLRVIMAVKQTGLEKAYDLALEWSQARANWVSLDDFEKTWRSLGKRELARAVTIGSIYKVCETSGWLYQAKEPDFAPYDTPLEPKYLSVRMVDEYWALYEKMPAGVLKDLTYYIYTHNRMMPIQWALSCAFITCSTIIGNKYCFFDGYSTGANLMVNIMGHSMSGKNAVIYTIRRMLKALGSYDLLIPPAATLEGIQDYLKNNGSIGLMMVDEAGELMSKDNDHMGKVGAAIREIYSTPPTDDYIGRLTAGNKGRMVIENPAVNVVLIGNYSNFNKMVDMATLNEGTLGRTIYSLHSHSELERTKDHSVEPISAKNIPEGFAFVAQRMTENFQSDFDQIGPIEVASALTTDANARLDEFLGWMSKKQDSMDRQLWGRLHENALKLALISACFDEDSWIFNGEPGALQEGFYQWSMEYLHLSRKHTGLFVRKNIGKSHATKGNVLQLVIEEIRLIRKIIADPNKRLRAKEVKRFGAIISRGYLPVAMLTQRVPQKGEKKYDMIHSRDVREAVLNLADRGRVRLLAGLNKGEHGVSYGSTVIKLGRIKHGKSRLA